MLTAQQSSALHPSKPQLCPGPVPWSLPLAMLERRASPCLPIPRCTPSQVLDAFRYSGVDGHPSVMAIISESKQLQEWQDLFELYVQVGASDSSPLQVCRTLELRPLMACGSKDELAPKTCWAGTAVQAWGSCVIAALLPGLPAPDALRRGPAVPQVHLGHGGGGALHLCGLVSGVVAAAHRCASSGDAPAATAIP